MKKMEFLIKIGVNFMADIRRDIGMAKENWPPAIRAAPLQPNAPNILFEIAEILCATKIYHGTEFSC